MALNLAGGAAVAAGNGPDWRNLGDEAPIEIDGRRHTADERRRVSVRWLSGTVLTGLSGALLISAAAYTARDGRRQSRQSEEG